MFLPVWAIILLGIGWLGFLWLLIRRDSGRDLAEPPRLMAQASPPHFGVPLPSGVQAVPPEVEAELRQLVAEGQKIQAIKRFREITLCSLADAKDRVERL